MGLVPRSALGNAESRAAVGLFGQTLSLLLGYMHYGVHALLRSSISSFGKYLLNVCSVPGTAGVQDTLQCKQNPHSLGICLLKACCGDIVSQFLSCFFFPLGFKFLVGRGN